ncbi:YuzD family protein [Halobacillus litoralis]|uniref:YuzD family protein n=1 Tax=Halobacillus litoralis TaxID=45668 RepID=UPI001CFEFA06|nr:YuzD family protein [Halobacillus litoralis]
MKQTEVSVHVYGAEVKCASCVNAPGSKETYEWLEAAVGRKYGNQGITFHYFDIHKDEQEGMNREIVQKILDDELFYPLVVIDDVVVAEGNPRLKSIYKTLEEHGIEQIDNS